MRFSAIFIYSSVDVSDVIADLNSLRRRFLLKDPLEANRKITNSWKKFECWKFWKKKLQIEYSVLFRNKWKITNTNNFWMINSQFFLQFRHIIDSFILRTFDQYGYIIKKNIIAITGKLGFFFSRSIDRSIRKNMIWRSKWYTKVCW